MSAFLILIVLTSASAQSSSTTLATVNDPASRYFQAAIQAADWISSFQVTPLSSNWGIPYPDQRAWGLDPFYYSNGTITADTNEIQAGSRQQHAFLIAGHDAGEGSDAALNAYLATHDPKYLRIFQVYYGYFQRSQLPNNLTQSSNQASVNGYWPEQASVQTGPDNVFGTSDDQVQLVPAFPAAEHGNPIAATLIAYYRLTNDSTTLNMLNRYGNWLLHDQIHSGEYAGAFPVTQYYLTIGWKPRMFETTESAWILCELYTISGNRTYLNAAIAAGTYMLSRQFTASNDARVEGALPYEWNRTKYNRSVSTNHAGFTLLAWTQLYRLTGDTRFLTAAQRYAEWLLGFQITTRSTSWGDHTYSNDTMAIGGYYYGYDTDLHTFGWRVALSLWSAAYAIPGLILLNRVTGDQRYLQSAELAAEWLLKMRFADQLLVPLQSLAIIKYVVSSWWGLYPQFYQPSTEEVQKSGITNYVNQAQRNPHSIAEHNLTWFEQTFNVSFNQIDYQMASRGPQYMKMIWSWWPSVGFEPRYGGDVAVGQFTIANYMKYNETIEAAHALIQALSQQVNNTQTLPYNLTRSVKEAEELLDQATQDYNDGWFPIATAKLEKATDLAMNLTNIIAPLAEATRRIQGELTITVVVISTLLIASNYYWYRHLKKPKRVRKGRSSRTKAS
ncbi:MAG TPA: hypothetical protein VMU35_08500 [Methylomirabilota bacterium]|nr:hypothetical protein [Methylomirabilota bacterium]